MDKATMTKPTQKMRLEKAAAFDRFKRLIPVQKVYYSSLRTNSALRLGDGKSRLSLRRQKRHNILASQHINALNMRPQTIDHLSKSVTIPGGVLRPSCSNCSLELLRKCLQPSINHDIYEVVQRYVEKFFQPAILNIRTNELEKSVNVERELLQVFCEILSHVNIQENFTTAQVFCAQQDPNQSIEANTG